MSHQPEKLGFFNVIGHFLYDFHREAYFWSIRNGGHLGLPLEHTCPSLYGFLHFGLPGKFNHKAYFGRRNYGYWLTAAQTISAGVELRKCRAAKCELGLETSEMAKLLATGGGEADHDSRHCRNRNFQILLEDYARIIAFPGHDTSPSSL